MLVSLILAIVMLAPQQVRMSNPDGLTPPQLAYYEDPFYTRAARDNRIEGIVTVEASFDAGGKMTVLRTVKGLGYGLDENALVAVRNWKFCPALRNGTPVPAALAQIDIDFHLAAAPSAEFDDIVHIRPGVTPPKVVKRVEPRYTDEARAQHLVGTVVLQGVIRPDGTVHILKVEKPLPAGLTESATEAIQQWKFEPGSSNGKPVQVALNIEVGFNLEKSDVPDLCAHR